MYNPSPESSQRKLISAVFKANSETLTKAGYRICLEEHPVLNSLNGSVQGGIRVYANGLKVVLPVYNGNV